MNTNKKRKKVYNEPPTAAQAELFARLNAAIHDPKYKFELSQVTCKSQRPEPPLEFIYHVGSELVHCRLSDNNGSLRVTVVHNDKVQEKTADPADKILDQSSGPAVKSATAGISRHEIEKAKNPAKLRWLLQSKGKNSEEIKSAIAELRKQQQGKRRLTRAEAEAWLHRQGFSADEEKLIMLRAYDKLTVVEIGESLGKSRPWYYKKLKENPKLRRWIRAIQNAIKLEDASVLKGCHQPATQLPPHEIGFDDTYVDYPSEYDPTSTLSDCTAYAHFLLSPKESSQGKQLPKKLSAKKVIEAIRHYPPWLLESERLRKALVDLLEAAYSGDSSRRVPVVVKKGSRKQVADRARKHIALLSKPLSKSGGYFDFDSDIPGYITQFLSDRIDYLQKQWFAFAKTGKGTDSGQYERFKAAHHGDLKDILIPELKHLLNGDPVTAAENYAERISGLSTETFHNSYEKNCKRDREKLAELKRRFEPTD